jgi:hypothetical protein
VPTTTNNTTITGNSNQNATTTEDNNDDLQPDRDSMVTPKLDESDYKSENESAETTLAAADQTRQKVTGQPAVESSDASSTDQQQTPSSSDIKAQEEPSSTTSPMPSTTSASTPAAPGANLMASPGSTPLPTGPTSSSDSLVAPPELQKAEINSETTKQTENAPKLQAALTSPIPQTDSLKSINQSKDSSDHKKQSENVESKSKLDVESALSALKEPLPAGMTGMNF